MIDCSLLVDASTRIIILTSCYEHLASPYVCFIAAARPLAQQYADSTEKTLPAKKLVGYYTIWGMMRMRLDKYIQTSTITRNYDQLGR